MKVPEQLSSHDRLLLAVVAITVVAIALRLIGLGQRVAHWDEARVAYFALQYANTGIYEYRPITHGPFLHVINGDLVFPLLGASDTSARLIVALIGGLLPATALLFRHRLRRWELISMALLLAVTPIILYYSRFMRNDLLLAAFMFAGFGLLIRYLETRRGRYLYAATAFVALGFTTKENAIIYLIVWVGAALLIIDHTAYRRGFTSIRERMDSIRSTIREHDPRGRDERHQPVRYVGQAALAVMIFVTVVTLFYLPRGPGQIGFFEAFLRPTSLGEVFRTGFIEPLYRGITSWSPAGEEATLYEHYLRQLYNMVDAIVYGALAIFLLAILGFFLERYRDQTREVVMFASYWGFVSLIGYPLAASVHNPAWLTMHVLIPLAIPAGVALGWIAEGLYSAIRREDLLLAAGISLILMAFGGQLAVAGISGVYLTPASHENPMVQFAQPEDPELRAALDDIETAVDDNEGLDILYYGSPLYDTTGHADAHEVFETAAFTHRLPLPWYTLSMDASVASVQTEAELTDKLDEEDPPVVISTGQYRHTLDPHLEEHTVYEVRHFPLSGQNILIYIDESRR